jgi:hypothetical protein
VLRLSELTDPMTAPDVGVAPWDTNTDEDGSCTIFLLMTHPLRHREQRDSP